MTKRRVQITEKVAKHKVYFDVSLRAEATWAKPTENGVPVILEQVQKKSGDHAVARFGYVTNYLFVVVCCRNA